jgi:hypothetical protein
MGERDTRDTLASAEYDQGPPFCAASQASTAWRRPHHLRQSPRPGGPVQTGLSTAVAIDDPDSDDDGSNTRVSATA